MKYYLKKCGYQELGSVDTSGRPQRGRYLLTSMNEDILSFFPPLSTAQLNDSALLPIIPFYTEKKVYCNYVYHNDKYHGSTAVHPRNEYRIYLNRELEDDVLKFVTDDIIVMRQAEIDGENGEKQLVYLLDLLQDHSTSEYKQCAEIVENYPIHGGYGLFEGVLSFFEMKAETLLARDEVPVVIDQAVTKMIEKTSTETLASLFNAATFRDFVMAGYEHLCAITGTVIRYESYINLEAAHIKPKSHGGLLLPNNGMALSRDLHWAFDKGFFTLNENLEVIVHPNTTSDFLRGFHGRKIRLPSNPFFIPDLKNVKYHNEVVFGLFKTTGRL